MKFGKVKVLLSNDFSSNSYVIEDELVCIVDPGFGDKDYGISFDEVDLVINTHGHFDHWGNDYLFSKAKIFTHAFDIPMIKTGIGSCYESFSKNFVRVNPLPIPNEIRLGDVVFKVIHTPGHTPGSICLFEKNLRILISGDTLFADGVGRTDLLGGNEAQLVESLKKIKELEFEHLLPGHGFLGTKEQAFSNINWLLGD